MPSLKQISCSLQLGSTKLKEYGHKYTDGGVETYVAVPEADVPFHIRLLSTGYIAPGLAAYVFIDGIYQCNRNRQKLKFPADNVLPSEYEVDIKLRQKEEKTAAGLFVAREWSFARLSKDAASSVGSNYAANLGTIEVVVLRCKEGGGSGLAVDPAGVFEGFSEPKLSEGNLTAVLQARAASKVSAKPTSRAPLKNASEVGDEVFGKMDIFDGCSEGAYGRGPDGVAEGMAFRQRQGTILSPQPPPPRRHQAGLYQPMLHKEACCSRRARGVGDEEIPVAVRRAPVHHSSAPKSQQYRTYRESEQDRADFLLVEELGQEVLRLVQQQTSEAEKHLKLEREAYTHRHEKAVFHVMSRAVERKAREVQVLTDELRGVYRGIDACIKNMDQIDRQRTRSYLLDRGVWPEPEFDNGTHLPPPGPTALRPGAPQRETYDRPSVQTLSGLSLWERKQNKQHGRTRWQDERKSSGNAEDLGGVDRWLGGRRYKAEAASAAQQSQTKAWPVDEVEQKCGEWSMKSRQNDAGWANNNDNGGWGENAVKALSNKARSQDQADDPWARTERGPSPAIWENNPSGKSDKASGNNFWAANGQDPNEGGNNSWTKDNSQHDGGGEQDAWAKQDNQAAGGWSGNDSQDNGGQGDAWGNGSNDQQQLQQPNSQNGDGWAANGEDIAQSADKDKNENNWEQDQQAAQGDGHGWVLIDKNTPKAATGGIWGEDGAKQQSIASKPVDVATSVSALRPVIKPYWQDWMKRSEPEVKKSQRQPRNPYDFPAPPAPAAPSRKADSIMHGVAVGRGASYAHRLYRPDYLDTMEKPYAVFTFRYRSREQLEKILGRKIDGNHVKKAVEALEQERLMRMPKDELVSELMKRQMLLNTPRLPTSSSTAGRKLAKSPSGNGWEAPADVKPSDSVSQQGSQDGGWFEKKPTSNDGQLGNDQVGGGW